MNVCLVLLTVCHGVMSGSSEPALAALRDAQQLAEAGSLREAYAVLEQVLKEAEKEEVQGALVNAMVKYGKGNTKAIEDFLESAWRVEEDLKPEIRAYLRLKIADRYVLLGQYDTAASVLTESLEAWPSSSHNWDMQYLLGYNEYKRGDFNEAYTILRKLAEQGGATNEQMRTVTLQMSSALHQAQRWQELAEVGENLLVNAENLSVPDMNLMVLCEQLAESYREMGTGISEQEMLAKVLELHSKIYPSPDTLQTRKRESYERRIAELEEERRELERDLAVGLDSEQGEAVLGSRSGGEGDPTAAQLALASSTSRGRGNAAEVRGQGKRAMSVVVLLGLLLLGGAAVVLIKRRNRAF